MVRRRREWQDIYISETTASGTEDNQTLVTGTGVSTKGLTLVRMIIDLMVGPAVPVSGSTDRMLWSAAIGIFSDEAISTVTFPSPSAQEDVPVTGWLWKTQKMIPEGAGEQTELIQINVDLRSQRKLMYGRPVLLIGSNPELGVVFDTKVLGLIRCLYLLD